MPPSFVGAAVLLARGVEGTQGLKLEETHHVRDDVAGQFPERVLRGVRLLRHGGGCFIWGCSVREFNYALASLALSFKWRVESNRRALIAPRAG